MIRTGRIEDSTTLVARPLAATTAGWSSPRRLPGLRPTAGRRQSIDGAAPASGGGLPESPRTGRTIDWLFSLDEGDSRDPHAGDAGGRRYRCLHSGWHSGAGP